MEKVAENSPTRHLLGKDAKYVASKSIDHRRCWADTAVVRIEANFKHHPGSVTASSKVKLVRYQQNPTPHWGPGSKPGGKRKRNDDE